MRSVVAQVARAWKGRPVWVGCSGNFTVERILAQAKIPSELHSNDVSLYTSALGAHLTGQDFRLEVRPAAEDTWGWLTPWLEPGPGRIATLMLCTTVMAIRPSKKGEGEPRLTAFARRQLDGYMRQWDQLHAKTVEKVDRALAEVRIDSYQAMDVVDFVPMAPEQAAVTSFFPTYCLGRDERILTADLQWLPARELHVGDQLLAFDDEVVAGRRCPRWKKAEVTRSRPDWVPCVRIHLEGGDAVLCSRDHPWLADRNNNPDGGGIRRWVKAQDLMASPNWVVKALDPWAPDDSYEAGWLAGLYDGEGSLSLTATSSGGLVMAQKPGPVADRFEASMKERGFDLNRRTSPIGVCHFEIRGGLPETLRALGQLRPGRLLDRFQRDVDTSTRSVRSRGNPRRRVLAVEDAGYRAIQSITTTARTYVGEGYLMHNSGGYEKLYETMEAVFDWDSPSYEVFTPERLDVLLEEIQAHDFWMVSRDEPLAALEPHLVATVKVTTMSKPVHMYASEASRTWLTRPAAQKAAPARVARLERAPARTGTLRISRLDLPVFASLRDQYLSAGLNTMGARAAYGVLVDDDLAGCFAIGAMRVPWADAYLATDFAVRPTEARHVAKLVLAAALSHEARLALQQSMNHLVRTLGTSAFTEKPVSAKYRGLFDLVKRDEAKDGRKVLHYRAATGRWSLADAYRWWYDKSYGENVNTITREAAV